MKLAQAVNEMISLAGIFQQEPNAEVLSQTKNTMKLARVTMVESVLLDGCMLSCQPACAQDGRNQINTQIEAMAAMEEADAERVTCDDIHPSIWKFAMEVTQGKKLS